MKTIKYTQKNSIVKTVIAIFAALLCFVLTCLTAVATSSTLFAETLTGGLDNTTIAEDLEDTDLTEYVYDESGSVQIIAFYEFGYSNSSSSDYELYFYIYNPQALYYNTRAGANVVNMAISYSDGEPSDYSNISLTYLDRTDDYLLYKFKVTDSSDMYSMAYTYAATYDGTRRYDIAGIQLWESGKSQPHDNTVGGTYYWSGYAKGYDAESEDIATLSCECTELTTLELDVHSTYYRPNGVNGTAYTRDTLHSVYFSIPNSLVEKYGTMTAVHATWLNAQTAPMFVTSNSSVYNAVYDYVGEYVNGGSYNYVNDADCNTNLNYALIASKYIESASYNNASYGFSYMSYNANRKHTSSDVNLYYLYYCFLTDSSDIEEDVLPSETILEYMQTFTDNYSGTQSYTLVADRLNSLLFEQYDDAWTDINIQASDTYTLTDKTVWQDWWQQHVGGGYYTTTGTTYEVSAIHQVEDSDFLSTESATCENLYIDASDYNEFKEYYDNSTANEETVYLFRYYQSDCTRYEVAEYSRGTDSYSILFGYQFGYDYIDCNAYFEQMWVQLGFEVIYVTLTSDLGVQTVIPVVMDPVNIAADGMTSVVKHSESIPWATLIVIALACCLGLWATSFVRKIRRDQYAENGDFDSRGNKI